MATVTPMAKRHPWEVPDCPNCDHDIYVEGSEKTHKEWKCHNCGDNWSEGRK